MWQTLLLCCFSVPFLLLLFLREKFSMSFIVVSPLTQNWHRIPLTQNLYHKHCIRMFCQPMQDLIFSLWSLRLTIFFIILFILRNIYLANIRPCCVYRIQTEFYLFWLGSAQFCSWRFIRKVQVFAVIWLLLNVEKCNDIKVLVWKVPLTVMLNLTQLLCMENLVSDSLVKILPKIIC